MPCLSGFELYSRWVLLGNEHIKTLQIKLSRITVNSLVNLDLAITDTCSVGLCFSFFLLVDS